MWNPMWTPIVPPRRRGGIGIAMRQQAQEMQFGAMMGAMALDGAQHQGRMRGYAAAVRDVNGVDRLARAAEFARGRPPDQDSRIRGPRIQEVNTEDRKDRDYAHYRRQEDMRQERRRADEELRHRAQTDSRRRAEADAALQARYSPPLGDRRYRPSERRESRHPPDREGWRDFDRGRRQQPSASRPPRDCPRDPRDFGLGDRGPGAIPGGSRREQVRRSDRGPGGQDGFIPGFFGTRINEERDAGLARWQQEQMGRGEWRSSAYDESRRGSRGGERRPERFDSRGRYGRNFRGYDPPRDRGRRPY